MCLRASKVIISMGQNPASRDFGSRVTVITAEVSQGLAAGSLLADRPQRVRSSTPPIEPPMLASHHCKHPGICLSWHSALSTEKRALSTERF